MKLRALRLHGFKSFADRTEVVFHDGITAIVGPNGCGKSNISDAIRWVLGEQRPTAIRGAKMEEAIFQGTVNRRPVNRGSVAMEVSNEDGALPVPYEEVEIARTVFRDGGSEYSLNRSACRLRDIQELCRDTGLGANAYAVIENRMIDTILSDRAEERRGLFEEAAGIGKYKDRRKAASRRLERAELDLQRLEDLIAEVQTKVRSLARQKGKAERFGELRKRRLDVEMAVVRSRLAALEEERTTLRGRLEGGVDRGESLQAEIQTAEARLEALRVEQVGVQKARSEAAAEVDRVRGELTRWERDLAVARERAGYAERRLEQLAGERDEAAERVEESRAGVEKLVGEADALEGRVEALRAREVERKEANEAVRSRLARARETLDEVEGREREVARRIAQLLGDAEGAEAQAEEMSGRRAHLEEELTEARESLTQVSTQRDLFADRLANLDEEVEAGRRRVESSRAALEAAKASLEAAREGERTAQDRASALATRQAALERMERDREGMDPVSRALLQDPPEGVVGVLADFLTADAQVIQAVEAYLGVLAHAVVVRDRAAAHRLSRWFREEWTGGGGLVVLPLDSVPERSGQGGLLRRVEVRGDGAPWVRALLAEVEYVDDELPVELAGSGVRVGGAGGWVEERGVLRVGNPMGASGLLERREELQALGVEVEEARAEADAAVEKREAAASLVRSTDEGLDEERRALREAEDTARGARSDEEARSERRERLGRVVADLERQLEGAARSGASALKRARQARAERESLLSEEEGFREERALAREALDAVQEEWEEARAEEARLTVERTRLEGELSRLRERRAELEANGARAAERVAALDREEEELTQERERVRELDEKGRVEMEALFQSREEASARLRQRDEATAALEEELAAAEKRAREARSAEREASEVRHRLELEAQGVESRIARIRERVEGEWGRPLERLMDEAEPVEGDEEELRDELRQIVESLDRIGPVNMLAVEEHEEESTRLEFLSGQRDDLVEARDDLRAAIREINQTATRLFQETFQAIRENFRETFLRLFEGGEADLWLEEGEDPLEAVIEIHASPRGKRTQRIDLLSGGERALTALSLLFGIYLVKPSPFCVLDEVDAPLDESNIGRFIKLLQEFKEQTQFVVITHNPRTIEAADWIYGVTMEEPGVSNIVGVRLEEALEAAGV